MSDTAIRSCPKCGSPKVIDDGVVFDEDRASKSLLQAGFIKRPTNILFRGNTSEIVRAVICGKCGYVELYVENAAELYAKYRQARDEESE